jgi:hypothetical protein
VAAVEDDAIYFTLADADEEAVRRVAKKIDPVPRPARSNETPL